MRAPGEMNPHQPPYTARTKPAPNNESRFRPMGRGASHHTCTSPSRNA
jgi:hypothetical protein